MLDVGREGFGTLVTKDHLDARLRELGLQLTLHLGGMIAAGVAILAALGVARPHRIACPAKSADLTRAQESKKERCSWPYSTLTGHLRRSWRRDFTERQAQALLDVGSEGYGALATKDHLDARLDEVDARLRELELRLRHDLTLRMGGMIAAGVALIAALELLSR